MKRLLALILALAVTVPTGVLADPILKPRKYSGPIPPGSITLRVGFLAGPENEEMIDFLDRQITPPQTALSEDFGNGISFDLLYTHKFHPQFALRSGVTATFLRSNGDGTIVRRDGVPDSLGGAVLDYERSFDVDIFVLDASAMYYFSDAAIDEFQSYIGGGFSFGFPHAKFTEDRVDNTRIDGADYGQVIERDEWSTEAGVHSFVGASYYFASTWAFNAEWRYQLMQTKFPLSARNEDGDPEDVRFDVLFTGFTISAGITRAF